MNRILTDLRYGWRILGKSRGFTLVAILTLAVAIGASTAIFSLVDTVRLRPLPYRSKIYGQVLRRATEISLSGCVLGLVISRLAFRAFESSLYQVTSFDPATMLLVSLLLLGVTLVAAYWPARRAAKVDPMVALREE